MWIYVYVPFRTYKTNMFLCVYECRTYQFHIRAITHSFLHTVYSKLWEPCFLFSSQNLTLIAHQKHLMCVNRTGMPLDMCNDFKPKDKTTQCGCAYMRETHKIDTLFTSAHSSAHTYMMMDVHVWRCFCVER